ncbi:MAG: thiosulfate oxidation carrier complex protein SoxZ [Roseobacter sp.]
MATGVKSRVKLPKTAKTNEIITIKTLITHRMESGQRLDDTGQLIPRSILNRFLCLFDQEVVVDLEIQPAVATNPFFEFEVRVPYSGTFDFAWYDDDGSVYFAQQKITVV